MSTKFEYKKVFSYVFCSRWAISSKWLVISACNFLCFISFSRLLGPLQKFEIILLILARMVNLGEFLTDTKIKIKNDILFNEKISKILPVSVTSSSAQGLLKSIFLTIGVSPSLFWRASSSKSSCISSAPFRSSGLGSLLFLVKNVVRMLCIWNMKMI